MLKITKWSNLTLRAFKPDNDKVDNNSGNIANEIFKNLSKL